MRRFFNAYNLMAILLILWIIFFRFSLLSLIENLLKPSQILSISILVYFLIVNTVKFILFIKKNKLKPKLLERKIPFFLIIIFGVLNYYNSHFLYVNMLSVMIFILGFYCILLQFYEIKMNSHSIFTILIVFALLPITNHLNGLFGFPLRYNISEIVESILSILPIKLISLQTILIIENRVTNIDIGCSGMNSIWGGSLAFLILSWIENVRISLRWFISGVIFLFLIILGNIIRTICLVLLYTVFNAKDLANIIHYPLGIILFVFPLLILFYLFRYTPFFRKCSVDLKVYNYNISKLYYIVLCFIILLGINSLRPPIVNSHSVYFNTIQNADKIKLKPLTFSEGEKELFTTYPIESYSKYRFEYEGLKGSFLLVETKNWKTHHNPKDCLRGNGFKIDSLNTRLIGECWPVSFATLNEGMYSSCFWFQSKECLTNDFSERIWKHFSSKEKHWVLVSILFDKSIDLYNEQNLHFIHWLKSNVGQILSKE